MTHIAYFKRQAKNLFKDYNTKTAYVDDNGDSCYKYVPRYFDIESILFDYEWDESDLTLMNAQHIIACMLGFYKWTDLLKASEEELELARLLFDNQDKIHIEDWRMYIAGAERDNKTTFDSAFRLEIFKHLFLNGETFENSFKDYRLNRNLDTEVQTKRWVTKNKSKKTKKNNEGTQITSLPLSKENRIEFIKKANSVFKTVMLRMMPCNPRPANKLWNAEDYVDNFLTEEMLPISKTYALSLIDAFMVHHVVELATEADKMVEQS